jgi:hypothetical protein
MVDDRTGFENNDLITKKHSSHPGVIPVKHPQKKEKSQEKGRKREENHQ